jgi:hypothetical protein
MTWEEIGKKYDKEKNCIPLFKRVPKLEKDWGRLISSTEKLIWLFAISNSGKAEPVKIPECLPASGAGAKTNNP